jgi:hypothetical protein
MTVKSKFLIGAIFVLSIVPLIAYSSGNVFSTKAIKTLESLLTNGSIGTILPGADATYNIGSDSFQWEDLYLSGDMTMARKAKPSIVFGDSDATDDDDNGHIYGNLTDTGTGAEDFDLHFRQQVAGTMTTTILADADGVITLGTSVQNVTVAGDALAIATTQTPASNAACTTGEIAWDANYIYICTASTVWKRAELTGGY